MKRLTDGIRIAAFLAGVAALGGCGGGGSGGSGGGPPPPQKYTVGGSVTGLASGDKVVLLDNSGDALTVSVNGSFVFSTALASDADFLVTVGTQPTGQTCAVSQGAGVITTQAVTSVEITCTSTTYPLEGTIWDLGYASGLVLANGSDTLKVPGGATSFTMPTPVAYGSPYDVTVEADPLALTCTVSKGSGTMNESALDTIGVGCAASESVLYSFAGGPADGASPASNVIQASDGNFYGVTSSGGSNGRGAIFRITPDGIETILHLFAGGTTDGFNARGGLIEASDGNFYGSSSAGGANGDGAVFKVTPDGIETILYSFAGGPGDGLAPVGSLVQASDGNFYGLTSGGGAYGLGTVFRLTPGGTETVVHSFQGGSSDGASPDSTLIQASDGNFYGLTSAGGPSNYGSVFMITPGGAETILHFFAGQPSDGAFASGHLIQARDGNFYGVTPGGGDGWGTVFEITPTGTETVLYASFGKTPDLIPQGGLFQASDGNFYGATSIGGSSGDGTVFEIDSAGDETHLYSFKGGADGAGPVGILQGSDGHFYGVTSGGGASGNGTVFMLK